MSRLLTDEKIETIQSGLKGHSHSLGLFRGRAIAKAQDAETLKAVEEWLKQYRNDELLEDGKGKPIPVYTFTENELQDLLHDEMPEEGV